jgi:PAS domain S-box-containing protein
MNAWSMGLELGVAPASSSPSRSTALLGLAFALTALVGVLDYLTGYEVRLGSLYLLPIALATWTRGRTAGLWTSAAACLCWLVSFSTAHGYSRPVLFYWDAVVMTSTFIVFVLLLARLRLALASADERFVRLLQEMEAAVCVVEKETGAVLYANRRLTQMLGLDSASLFHADFQQRFGGRQGAGTPSHDLSTKTSSSSGFTSEERRDPITGRWYLVQSGPIPWRSGLAVTLHVVTDITDRRHAAQLRREHQDMLHRTARVSALSEITSALAHEINQPLMAIASYNGACLRLLEKDPENRDDLTQALEKSRAQALRAGEILRRMRDFVRSRHPQPEPCDLNAIVREALELMDVRLEDNDVASNLILADHLPRLSADRFLLVQVVVNLLENAVDAMRARSQGSRQLTLTTFRHVDGAACVSVTDNGEGISTETAEHLYTPFQSSKPSGLGLGLSICRSVVEAHGGRLWHEPNQGGGTVFHFTVGAQAQ